ncbi:putative molybdopterin biosynthesis protein [Bradyrhizobium diazoefficiens]
MEFLTTSEAADYLRLGERKLYELVTTGAIPCSKVTGKWLFPRHELDLWVLSGLARPAGMLATEPPPVVGGSQDELLDWSLRESGSGLGSMSEGSARGLERLQRDEVTAVAVHFHGLDASGNLASDANVTALRDAPDLHDALLVAFARREQGLVLPPGNPKRLRGLADVLALGARMAMRQQGTGAQMLLDVLLKRADATTRDLRRVETPALTAARSCRNGPRRPGRLRGGDTRGGALGRPRFRAAGLGKSRSGDATAQLFPPHHAGPDPVPERKKAAPARRGADRLRPLAGGADPLRRLTLTPAPK